MWMCFPLLTSLVLSSAFNQVIDVGILPVSLTSLSFRHGNFNQILPVNVFPPSLTTLKLSGRFDQRLEIGVFPSGLVSFDVDSRKSE